MSGQKVFDKAANDPLDFLLGLLIDRIDKRFLQGAFGVRQTIGGMFLWVKSREHGNVADMQLFPVNKRAVADKAILGSAWYEIDLGDRGLV